MADIGEIDIRRLDGGLLLVFRELLRTRSATETAARLHMSQSAVSHALARLRDIFDDRLFVRRSHGFEPTGRALELAPRIEALVDLAADTLRGDGAFNPASSERRFILGVPQFLAALIGAPLARALRKTAPRASFHIQHLMPEPALHMLGRGQLDLALGRFGTLHRDGLAVEELYRDDYCVVARKRHPVLEGSISLGQYGELGHVISAAAGEGDPGETLPDPHLLATTAIVPGWLTALNLVAACDAIATCPRRLAESQARALNLQVLDLPFDWHPFAVSIARRTRSDDPAVDWFFALARECMR